MFKSSFIKYITAFAAVMLVSFIMLSSVINTMIGKYVRDDKLDSLEWIAESASDIAEAEMSGYGSTFKDFMEKSGTHVMEAVDRLADRFVGTVIIIADADGSVLASNVTLSEGAKIPDDAIFSLRDSGEYTADSQNLSGLLLDNYIVTARPILDGNGSYVGSVFVCGAYSHHNALMAQMQKTVFMSSLWIMLAAIIAFYFLCDRTVAPLRSMVGAAKDFAQGKLDTRVEVRGRDEIAELAVAFNNMAQSLENNEKMRNSFLSNVSHDLRTPMTPISGFIDGITSGAIPPEKHAYYLRVISDEVHRLSRLVTRLLDLSRLESRKFEFINFDICEMAWTILVSFEQKIEEKGLDVEFDTSEDKIMVHADKDTIHRVMYNLIENATKFAKDGGRLSIKIKSNKNKVKVTVFDEGKSIPEEDIPYVFDRFYKTDKSRGLDSTGVGLGLYIAKTIIEAHGEKIAVRSPEGACEFEFSLKEAVLEPHANTLDITKK